MKTKSYDPRTTTNEQLQKEVDSGKIDAYKRTDNDGIQRYKTTKSGETIIKDVEPANNPKMHQQTDFRIKDGYIVEIRSHND